LSQISSKNKTFLPTYLKNLCLLSEKLHTVPKTTLRPIGSPQLDSHQSDNNSRGTPQQECRPQGNPLPDQELKINHPLELSRAKTLAYYLKSKFLFTDRSQFISQCRHSNQSIKFINSLNSSPLQIHTILKTCRMLNIIFQNTE
jgi:hypothetical protein